MAVKKDFDNQPVKVIKQDHVVYKCHVNNLNNLSDVEYYSKCKKIETDSSLCFADTQATNKFITGENGYHFHSLDNILVIAELEKDNPVIEITCKDKKIRIKYSNYTHVIRFKEVPKPDKKMIYVFNY